MPAIVYQKRVDCDTITGIAVGNITNSVRKEILLSCYSGEIKTLVDKKHAKRLGTLTENQIDVTDEQAQKEKQMKLTALKQDIFKMKTMVEKEDEKV